MIIKPTDFSDAKWERKPHGSCILDGREVGTTLQCVHCGAHFLSVKGSGIKRGFCTKCMGPTCGKSQCFRCKPYEKQIEEIERKARCLDSIIKP